MTLEQLRIFVAVAEREHLTRAASALHLTPSAVSSAVRALEDRYGAPLFHRVGRGIEITEAGRIFLGEAKATLARAQAAELALSELGGLKRGTLNIEASQTIASYWLPPVLVRFHDTHPDIDLRLVVGNTRSVARAVLDGIANLGFVEGEIDEPALSTEAVAEDRLIAVVAPEHPWAHGRRILPDDITDDPKAAAQSFIRITNAKQSEAEVIEMIQHKDTKFSTTPDGVMQYADFMHAVGSVKIRPASWKDLFMPELQHLPGS